MHATRRLIHTEMRNILLGDSKPNPIKRFELLVRALDEVDLLLLKADTPLETLLAIEWHELDTGSPE